MYFEEFASHRLTELLRFAVVLTGDEDRAEGLVAEVVGHAASRWNSVLALGRPFAVVRAGVTRAYLGDDASTGVARPTPPFAQLTPFQRAVLALSVYSGQTTAEVAAALESSAQDVDDAHRASIVALGLADSPNPVAAVTDLLDGLADESEPDADAARARIVEAPASTPEEFTALFGSPGEAVAVIEPAAAAPTYVLDEPTASPASPGVEGQDAEPRPAAPAGSRSRAESFARVGPLARAGIAVGIVVVAVVLSVLVGHQSRTGSAAAVSSPAPTASPSPLPSVTAGALSAPIRSALPGGRLLGEFFGSGPRTVAGAVYSVAAGRELMVNAICSGGGSATIGPVTLTSCTGASAAAVVSGRSLKSVTVRARAGTTWRFVVVDSQPRDTTAQLQYPASSLLRGGSVATRVARASGTGSADVPLASGATSARAETLRVELTCTGSGLALSTADGSLTGATIGTCYDGWSYAFTISRAVLPGTVRVVAPDTATWQLVVVRG